MHSRGKGARRAHVFAAGMVAALLTCRPAAAAAQPPATEAARPSDLEIDQALEQVRADPNLSPERKVRTLRWIGSQRRRRFAAPGCSGWCRRPGGSPTPPDGSCGSWARRCSAWSSSTFRRAYSPPGGRGHHIHRSNARPRPGHPARDAARRYRRRRACAVGARRAARGAGAPLSRHAVAAGHVHRMPIRDSSTEGRLPRLARRGTCRDAATVRLGA